MWLFEDVLFPSAQVCPPSLQQSLEVGDPLIIIAGSLVDCRTPVSVEYHFVRNPSFCEPKPSPSKFMPISVASLPLVEGRPTHIVSLLNHGTRKIESLSTYRSIHYDDLLADLKALAVVTPGASLMACHEVRILQGISIKKARVKRSSRLWMKISTTLFLDNFKSCTSASFRRAVLTVGFLSISQHILMELKSARHQHRPFLSSLSQSI